MTSMSQRTSARRRVGPALLLLALLLHPTVAPAPAQAARKSKVPVLAGTTKVAGSSTGVMRVTLPRPVTIATREGANPDITLEGAGRLTGVVLTQSNVGEYERSSLTAVRFGYCGEPGCSSGSPSELQVYGRGAAPQEPVTLEAGTYLLYVIADGSPVTATLRLRGLPGKTTLVPNGETHSGFVSPTAANSTALPGEDSFWYGEEVDFRGEAGMVVAILRFDVDNWVDIHYGDCAYQGSQTRTPASFSPACPGGISVYYNEMSATPSSHAFDVPILSEIGGGGTYGYGLYYTGVADVSDAYSMFFHLSLDADF